MAETPPIPRRAQKILQAVVKEYLQSGEAVGSRTVTRRHEIGLSPATVRNVMADLEELGLLEQPHTSAGRVPTERGLRFFVDSLLKVRGLSSKEKEAIRLRYGGAGQADRADAVAAVVQRTSRILADITQHTGIVLAPDPSLQRFQHIEFVPLSQGKFLCILVTTEGRIENKLVQLELDLGDARLDRIHNYLDTLLSGLSLTEVRRRILHELGQEKNRYDDMVSAALRLGRAALDADSGGRTDDVVVTGQANIVDLARADDPALLERMRQLLQTLEDKEVMLKLLDRTMSAGGIQVFLGAETAISSLGESSVVAVSYGPEEQPIGAIAVIGPRRMNYSKVISVVDFTADLVSQIIGEL
ncbi:heat-inducible transcriptional repressor HrcA [Haliangium ochraceum]|uniref:Heat-inducible transcription repressor HrcA n=1 Tax=Haliangium ochraceum (strain DSM 14365 / JCM 11303 / SMP-2) TaxID=502025 RepID=D0LKN5_HALO1|nr:heat-inducible transcriptional repressor HrcA [Haliangium ochraceum]ACY15083.1 heat-inducible transcription repressor HrcA [Haliangium ochraceum DSM 14365]